MKLDPDLPVAQAHRAGCGSHPGVAAEPRSTRGRWRVLVLIGVHLLIAGHLWHASRGRSLAPLEPSEAGRYWTEGVLNAGLVLLVLLIVSTLLLGRFFCGWACHVVALQDGSAWLLSKFGIRPRPIRSRLLAFVPLLAALEIFLLPGLLRGVPDATRWEFATDTFFTRFPGPVMTVITFLAVGLAAVWILGAKGFCSYGCPYGALFSIADRVTKARILVSDACEGCGHCTAVCTSGVQVHREVRDFGQVVDPGCMKCMDCVSACPKDALSFGFGPAPKALAAKSEGRPRKTARQFDFSWPEELLMVVVFFLGVFALRGLVPLLLAVILSVFAALGGVLTSRLALRGNVRFQGRVLRSNGRWTGSGGVAAAVLLLGAGFVASSLWLKFELLASGRALRAGLGPAAVQAPLLRARRLAFLPVPGLELEIGRQAELLRDLESATQAFERAASRFPEDPDAHLGLSRTRASAGDFEGAALALEAALDLREDALGSLELEQIAQLLPTVQAWIEAEPDGLGPTLLLTRFQIAVGDGTTARKNLEMLQTKYPGESRVEARLASIALEDR